ncbi:hypothetical protein E2C01_070708 [Portunus trituberculatus]|uniref:Uncharacterized protein n=1 Tax=Portunus trituberculatus TaxID=210409 RepID=A0A5B7I5Z8_PORTR|nr:hypothetical protein [Portunus trituberculatus]
MTGTERSSSWRHLGTRGPALRTTRAGHGDTDHSHALDTIHPRAIAICCTNNPASEPHHGIDTQPTATHTPLLSLLHYRPHGSGVSEGDGWSGCTRDIGQIDGMVITLYSPKCVPRRQPTG